ncbi:hypothetical protein IKE67_08690 [bacterium]|nr:hypothetical protein [bacterium]
MTSELHKKLVELGAKYLLNHQICKYPKSTIVATEINISCGESPDIIGFSGYRSFLIEAKQSRQDFKKDFKKWFRKNMECGMGDFRMYIAPKGLIKPDELPSNWGLIEVNEKDKCRMIVKPQKTKGNKEAEMLIMASLIKRIGQTEPKGVSIKCYLHESKNTATLTVTKEKQQTKQTKRFDLLKSLSVRDFANAIAIDNVGDCRGVCPICQRNVDDNCDDCCVNGIVEYLEQKV